MRSHIDLLALPSFLPSIGTLLGGFPGEVPDITRYPGNMNSCLSGYIWKSMVYVSVGVLPV